MIVSASQPVILYGSHGHLGRCTETWSSESLKERVGVTKEVGLIQCRVRGFCLDTDRPAGRRSQSHSRANEFRFQKL